MINGNVLFDTNGAPIHAHGGHIIKGADGFWYWYGENRADDCYVNCYRSKDLNNWEFRNHVLHKASVCKRERFKADLSLVSESCGKVTIERPKVLYNEKSGKYIMWMHYENGHDYLRAACAVASCDTPDGDFTFHGSFNPYGYMSRDCTIFKDSDGTAYFISASRDNADLHIYRLQSDYMNIESLVCCLFCGEYREAPAVFFYNNRYYMLTSQCTGWKPNQGGVSYAACIEGPWTPIEKFGDETTYRTQPAFVLPVGTASDTHYVYVGDRWGGSDWDFQNASASFDYSKSSYYFSKLNFNNNGDVLLTPTEQFEF